MTDDITSLRTAEPARSTRGPVPVRDAASLILIDRRKGAPRVLMGRRHAGHVFMPGRMVFPGGRVDASDRTMRAYGALPAHTERNLLAATRRGTPGGARTLALCAIRETAEETGILFGERNCGVPPCPAEGWRAFAEHGVFPALDALFFVARAITPPGAPRRFDTRFFAGEAQGIAHIVPGVVGPDAELTDTAWLTLPQAQASPVADITRVILGELASRLEAGLERDLPVPFFHETRRRWLRDEI